MDGLTLMTTGICKYRECDYQKGCFGIKLTIKMTEAPTRLKNPPGETRNDFCRLCKNHFEPLSTQDYQGPEARNSGPRPARLGTATPGWTSEATTSAIGQQGENRNGQQAHAQEEFSSSADWFIPPAPEVATRKGRLPGCLGSLHQ